MKPASGCFRDNLATQEVLVQTFFFFSDKSYVLMFIMFDNITSNDCGNTTFLGVDVLFAACVKILIYGRIYAN